MVSLLSHNLNKHSVCSFFTPYRNATWISREKSHFHVFPVCIWNTWFTWSHLCLYDFTNVIFVVQYYTWNFFSHLYPVSRYLHTSHKSCDNIWKQSFTHDTMKIAEVKSCKHMWIHVNHMLRVFQTLTWQRGKFRFFTSEIHVASFHGSI